MATSRLREPVTLLLPFAPMGVGLARRRLVADLKDGNVAQASIDDARVVLSELIANAIRHARPLESGRISVSWLIDERGITIEVSDGGGVTDPTPTQAGPMALGGRGLTIVATLSADWGVRTDGSVTTVYATIDTLLEGSEGHP